MKKAESQFRHYLRARGLRFTRERREVFLAALAARGHFGAGKLHVRLLREGKKISLATVYRLIPLLEGSAMIRRAAGTGSEAVYEPVYGREPHYHLVCGRCGAIEEFAEPRLDALLKDCCRRRGFQASEHRLIARGLCRKCRKERTA